MIYQALRTQRDASRYLSDTMNPYQHLSQTSSFNENGTIGNFSYAHDVFSSFENTHHSQRPSYTQYQHNPYAQMGPYLGLPHSINQPHLSRPYSDRNSSGIFPIDLANSMMDQPVIVARYIQNSEVSQTFTNGVPFPNGGLPTTSSVTPTNAGQGRRTTSALLNDGGRSATRPTHDIELQRLAQHIRRQSWFITQRQEPDGPSSFLPFFDNDNSHRCRLKKDNGERCDHTASRPGRATAHAYKHFGYQPFACNGACGREDCTIRYECEGSLTEHLVRALSPEKQCEFCKKPILSQNLARHIRAVHKTSLAGPRNRV